MKMCSEAEAEERVGEPATPNKKDNKKDNNSSSSSSSSRCFQCRNEGHWAKNCPFNFNSSPSPPSQTSPSIPCPDGHGPCFLTISRSQSNPGRRYYACSSSQYGQGRGRGQGGDCRFFKWADQVIGGGGGVKRPLHPPPDQDYPNCRCGAGKCKLIYQKNASQYYFVCPIQKGHGACSFRTGVDDSQALEFDSPLTDNPVLNERPKKTKFDSPLIENPDPISAPLVATPCIQETPIDRRDHGDILDCSTTNQEMQMGAQEQGNFTLEKTLQVSCLTSKTVGPPQSQSEFLRHISAADPIQQMVGTHILGWLGRLAFPPSRCLLVPQARPFFCCVFPSFDRIYVPKDVDAIIHSGGLNEWPHGHSNSELGVSPQILSQDSECGVLSELSCIKSVPGIREGRDFTGAISKALAKAGLHVQNQLLTILECTDPHNHNSMTEAANKTFAVLNLLSVDHRAFSERVRKFISCASELAKLEESTKGKVSSKEIAKQCENEKAKLGKISKLHAETMDAITASEKQVESLGEKAWRLKEKLARIESELRHREMENGKLKTRAGKIREDMVESRKKLQEAKAAKKLHEERSAAKEALERARFQLRHSSLICDN